MNVLQIDDIEKNTFIANQFGEIGNIVKWGLKLNSEIFDANDSTTKFIKIMNLLEFLAFPDRYEKFELVKKEICCHIAKNKNDYLLLLERFFKLTGFKDKNTGEYLGYRTRVIHMGGILENFLTETEIKKLLLELQGYIMAVITDMISNNNMTLEEFYNHRRELKNNLN